MFEESSPRREPIAIVGIGCNLPGKSRDPESFWRMLCNGVDAVGEIPLDRWDWRPFYDPEPGRPGRTYARWAGLIEGIDQFDPEFFGISPREAPFIDPQQRLLLETTWAAFEDAGQTVDIAGGSDTGVFVGLSTTDYSSIQMAPGDRGGVDAYSATGGTMSIAANRISYCFNFQGPSVAVDTACSSSLVAVHLACNALWEKECRLAVAAGVNCIISPAPFVAFCSMGMLSPDGRCKAFDARANGFVRGEGAGAVLLKPLSAALADGDSIYAVIRSTAVNQDGRTTGMTVPSRQSQEALVRAACRQAGVSPRDIQYVEAHGTGTAVGDPIETNALGTVLGADRAPGDECLIGSVKTNIGHLEAGAGVAGIIKLALSLRHGAVPPNLHFQSPNPAIDFARLRLRVPQTVTPLRNGAVRPLGCINSFGFGGTNAHAILEAPPLPAARTTVPVVKPAPDAEAPALLLPLSARGGDNALKAVARTYQEFLSPGGGGDAIPLAELCRAAGQRRTHHEHRLAVTGRTHAEIAEALGAFAKGEAGAAVTSGQPKAGLAGPVFVFSGQGPQWWAMGRELLASEPVFRDKLRECHEALLSLGGWPLLDELRRDESASRLQETEFAQPAIFALQVALAALWKSWGIRPAAVVGHSVGEVAAVHEAGVLGLREAMRVIYHRGRCMEHAPARGKMIAAALTPAEAEPLIAGYGGALSLAAINSPTSVSISGDAEAVDDLFQKLESRSVFVRQVPVNYAFHSAQMDPVRDELLAALDGLSPQAATLPIFSTVSGERADGTGFTAGYWWHNVRETVRFEPAIRQLLAAGHLHFLEISAHPVLSPSLNECLAGRAEKGTVVSSLRRQTPERAQMLGALGALFTLGHAVDWSALHPGAGPFAPLPHTPWQRQSYWNESPLLHKLRLHPPLHPLLGRALPSADPGWETQLDKRVMPWLLDHRAGRHMLLPASAYVEMAVAAGRETFGAAPFVVEELDIPRGCVIPPGDEIPVLQFVNYPSEGIFNIRSNLSETTPNWVQHAAGRLRAQPERITPANLNVDVVRARFGEGLDGEQFYERVQSVGLFFGPHFRGVTRVWSANGEALGRVELNDRIRREADSYVFHPAFLDGCFQVIGALELEGLLLPARLERIRFHARSSGDVWTHVRLRKSVRGKMAEVDLRVFDDAGKVLLEVDGFRIQSADIGVTAGQSSDWLYQLQWKLKPLPGRAVRGASSDYLPDTRSLGAAVQEEVTRLSRALGLRQRYQEWEPQINRLCQAYILQAFTRLGWVPKRGGRVTTGGLMEQLSIQPKHRRLIARLLGHLESDGLLRRVNARPARGETEPAWSVARSPKPADIRATWRDILNHFPAFHPELTLLERCGGELAGVLRGERDPLQLMFPGGSLNTLEHLYENSVSSRIQNHSIARAVEQALAGLPEGRRVRILEIGAGTGGLTAGVLPVLPPGRADYVFSDVSNHFFNKAEQKFQDHPFLQYQLLDIEKPPAAQGFEPHSFDIILASDVLHATADLRAALAHVRELLAPRGMIGFIEVERPDRYADLVFGLTEGWWRFQDTDLRPDYPLLDRTQWETLLTECGFSGVAAISDTDSTQSGQMALLARGPSVDVPAPAAPAAETAPLAGGWLILADASGVADALAAELRARGGTCWTVRAGDAFRRVDAQRFEVSPSSLAGMKQLLAALPGDVRGILHLWSLDAPEGEKVPTAELAAAQELSCHSALFLTQALVAGSAAEKPQLWLITRGAQPAGEHITGLAVARAPLCGLGRVILNEHPDLRCRMVDLDPAPSPEDVRVLVDELCGGDNEEEIAWRGEARYVQRLVRGSFESAGRPAKAEAVSTAPCRLESARAGSLDRLVFRPFQRRAPGPGEVEIEVCAAALNFRDVMKALGIYPAEAEDALLLGDECAGRIAAVGPDVTDFKVGDEVMALSAGCFTSHLITPAITVLHKPAHLTMEEAATMLVTYMTAMYALHQQGRMQRGEKVLIHAATGGVGQAAVQVARLAGAEVFATAGSPEKRDFLRFLGVQHVMDSRTLGFADEILAATDGRGVDIVLNSLAGEAIHKSLSVLGTYGRFLEIGKRDIYGNTRVGLRPFRNNLSYFAIDLGHAMSPRNIGDLMGRLKRGFKARNLPPLPHRIFPFAEAASAFRYITQARQVGKVVLAIEGAKTVPTPEPPPETIRFSSDATYLIAGGLGGFGLSVARWLVDNGARHLVLTGRSGAATEEARQAVADMEAKGARVVPARSDVSNPQDVERLFREMRETLPPLRGVIHAAMVLDDGLITQLDGARFKKAMTPKVDGAWNLHRQTAAMDLDFFVLFSSVSSVVGSPGQANYVAANTFLDALAQHRRLLGLPALAVNWGVLAEVGYVSRHKKLEEHFQRMGWTGLTPAQTLPVLARLLQTPIPQMTVLKVDWSQWAKTGGRATSSPRYELLTAPEALKNDQYDDGERLRESLLAASPEQRQAMMEDFLREQIAKVLRTSPAKIDVNRPLNELGLDSLMAVELLHRVEGQLSVAMPTSQLMGGPTIVKMAGILVDNLTGGKSGAKPRASAAPASSSSATAPADDAAPDFAVDTRLDADIRFADGTVAPRQVTHPAAVLLTGATQFLGAYLLVELLEQTTAEVHCLVDAPDADAGLARLRETLAAYSLSVAAHGARIHVVPGDVSRPRLGLAQERFDELAATVDAVYHAQAEINHIYPYRQLRPVNVTGTMEIIRFAAHARPKPVHHVSSFSALTARREEAAGPATEDESLDVVGNLLGGYSQSRWVAEQLLARARERGLPVSLYRPGLLSGDAKTGAGSPEDFVWRLVKSCIELGCGPDAGFKTQLTPVDFAARALVRLSLNAACLGKNFHLVPENPLSWARLLELTGGCGYPMRVVSTQEWERLVTDGPIELRDNPLAAYLLFLPTDTKDQLHVPGVISEVDSTHTREGLAGTGVRFPDLDADWIRKYTGHFVRTGFFPPPK